MSLLAAGLFSGIAIQTAHRAAAVDSLPLWVYFILGCLLLGLGDRLHRVPRQRSPFHQEVEIGTFDIDLVQKEARASAGLAKLIGAPVVSNALPYSAWQQYLPQAALDDLVATFRNWVLSGSHSFEHEFSLPIAKGRPLGLLARVQVRHLHGKPVHLYGSCIEMNEQRAADTRLAKTQALLHQQLSDLRHLHELSSHLLELPDLQSQLQLTLKTLTRLHDCNYGVLALCTTESGKMQISASEGLSPEDLHLLVQENTSPCKAVLGERSRTIISITDLAPQYSECVHQLRRHGFHTIHSTPLISAQGELLGALAAFISTQREVTVRECTLADICARKAVLFIERDRAREKLQEAHALIGRSIREVLPEVSASSPAFNHCAQVIAVQRTFEFDIISGKGAQARWFHCIASPTESGVAIWFNDITERIRNEQKLRHSDKRKDEFLATLAHELRNPLAPIRHAVHLLTSDQATDQQKRWASEVTDRQVQRMALLLDDLLDVPRISRGTLVLRKRRTDLDEVIALAIETARPHMDARSHALSVHRTSPPLWMDVDPLRLAQVIANLLNNAAKYTPNGGHISLSLRREKDEAVIEVSDNGIGIAPADIPEVFRMFTQLHHGGEKSNGGLGIGLALSKGLVELHGGLLMARSEGADQGSTFTVRLPISDSAIRADALILPAPAKKKPARRHKILVADDNRDASSTLAAVLAIEVYPTRQAHDGEEALAMWHAFEPDICLLDIGMPKLSGYQVAQAIRRQPGGTSTFLVAVSGWGQLQDRKASMDAGFDLHLTKPVSPEQIHLLLADE